ncbi:dienelactone hydrolase [Gorgonomyces haynaldii]|nr:dienelactone hydrolase [Gorgonomyces haynaldii]
MASLDCVSGFVHDGEPFGKVLKANGIDYYVAGEDKSKTSCVIIATDILGFEFKNARLEADAYSEQLSVPCFVPDLFEGTGVPVSALGSPETRQAGMDKFVAANPFPKNIAIAKKFIKHLRSGFCWGGKICAVLSSQKSLDEDYPSLLRAIAAAHPSRLELPNDIENIDTPFCFILPENDGHLKAPEVQLIRDIVQSKNDCPVHHYPGVGHGFAVRGNKKSQVVMQAADDAFVQVVAHFKKYL